MDLSPGEIQALKDLVLKELGEPVDFVRIADALSLTRQGLAVRTAQGWSITAAGRQRLQEHEPPGA